jgi:transposase-like protein
VQRWTRSGLTATRFAQQEGVNAGTLAFWRWKLRRGTPGRRRQAAPARQIPSPIEFVEVLPAPSPRPGTEPGAALELVVTGYRVRVGAGFDRAVLRELLDVLEARR